MKTFNRLTVGDTFYEVYDNKMEYEKHLVNKVDHEKIYFDYSKDIPRWKEVKGEQKEYSRYGRDGRFYYFTLESDVIRFCKARMMKNLFNHIESAKRSIESVKEFRNKHYELLNHKWTEDQINKLEKQLK